MGTDVRYIPIQILETFGYDVVHQSGKELVYICPYCRERNGTPDQRGHLYVNVDNLTYFCQRCGAKGYLGHVDVKGYDFTPNPSDPELMKQIGEIIGREEEKDHLYSLEDSRPLWEFDGSKYETDAIEYLENRGFGFDTIVYYGIRLGNFYSRYRNRVIIPNEITTIDGIDYTDMFVGRAFADVGVDKKGRPYPKYVNPAGDNRRRSVFNLHRIEKGSPIVITEGCITSMSAGSNAVATYGKYVTDIQLKRILGKRPSLVYVALDPDALDVAEELCKRISRLDTVPIKLVVLPDGEDANSLGHLEFMRYVDQARDWDAIEYNIEKALA